MMKMESKENKNNESKLTKHDITMLGIRSSLLQASFSYERMQAGGWTWAQIPVWRKIFGNDKKALSQTMADNLEFINTSPPLVSILMGLLTSLEEKHVNRETIRGLKNGLFGPMAGIGDAIYWYFNANCWWDSSFICNKRKYFRTNNFLLSLFRYIFM